MLLLFLSSSFCWLSLSVFFSFSQRLVEEEINDEEAAKNADYSTSCGSTDDGRSTASTDDGSTDDGSSTDGQSTTKSGSTGCRKAEYYILLGRVSELKILLFGFLLFAVNVNLDDFRTQRFACQSQSLFVC